MEHTSLGIKARDGTLLPLSERHDQQRRIVIGRLPAHTLIGDE
jgi:hypothetical protein